MDLPSTGEYCDPLYDHSIEGYNLVQSSTSFPLKGTFIKDQKENNFYSEIRQTILAGVVPSCMNGLQQITNCLAETPVLTCKNMSRKFNCDIVQLELFVATLFKSTY